MVARGAYRGRRWKVGRVADAQVADNVVHVVGADAEREAVAVDADLLLGAVGTPLPEGRPAAAGQRCPHVCPGREARMRIAPGASCSRSCACRQAASL